MEKTVSTTDPDARMLRRSGKPGRIHYLDRRSVDIAHGIVVDMAVTPGSASDSELYLGRIGYMREHVGLEIQEAGADSACDTNMIYRAMEDMSIRLHTPGETGGVTYRVELEREDFRYDAEKDCFLCLWGEGLTLRGLEKESYDIYQIYGADRKDCRACPMLSKYVSNSRRSRTTRKNIFEEVVKGQRKTDDASIHKRILGLRQIWCGDSLAVQKWMRNLRCLSRRKIEAAEDHYLLSATALNLKRVIKCLG